MASLSFIKPTLEADKRKVERKVSMSGLLCELHEVKCMLISSCINMRKYHCMDYISSGLYILICIFRFLFSPVHFSKVEMFKLEA